MGPRLATLRAVARRWGPLLGAAGKAAGVPRSWLLAFTAAESGGDPTAVSPAGAVGLLQLMPAAWRGHTRAEMMDPTRNARYAAELMALVQKTQAGTPRQGLPAVASVYNCGSDNAHNTPRLRDNAWGLCAEGDYIEQVVAGNNSAILDPQIAHGTVAGTPSAAGAVGLAAIGILSLIGLTLRR